MFLKSLYFFLVLYEIYHAYLNKSGGVYVLSFSKSNAFIVIEWVCIFNSLEHTVSSLPLGWTTPSHSSFGYLMAEAWSGEFGRILRSTVVDTTAELYGKALFKTKVGLRF